MKNIVCSREILPFGGNGRFICGKSENILDELVDQYRQSVTLFYLDPPFCTGDVFKMNSPNGKINAYSDTLSQTAYMRMLNVILTRAHDMLTKDGSIYLHIDYRMSAKVRLLLDKIFGEPNFVNEIIWSYKSGGRARNFFPRKHDTIFLYKKGSKAYFDLESLGKPRGALPRNNMRRCVDENGQVYFTIKSNGKLYKYYETDFIYPTDVWDDIEHLHQRDVERVMYPTQKPQALLRRILLASSYEGSLVCDPFSGSGTTAVVADNLNRKWIAIDSSKLAATTLRKRLINAKFMGDLLNSVGQTVFEYSAKQKSTPHCTAKITRTTDDTRISVYDDNNMIDQFSVGHIKDKTFFSLYDNVSTKKHNWLSVAEETLKDAVVHVIFTNGDHCFIPCSDE